MTVKYIGRQQSPEELKRNLDEVLRTRTPPGLNGTDRAYMSNKLNREFEGMNQATIDEWKRRGKEIGFSFSGKSFLHSAANGTWDFEAWISNRDEVGALHRKRGWGCEGMVEVKREDFDAHPNEGPYQVADDLVEDHTNMAIMQNPEIAPTPKEKAELKEKIREQITPTHL